MTLDEGVNWAIHKRGSAIWQRNHPSQKKKESTSTFTYYWVGAPGLGGHEPGLPNGQ